MTQNNSETSHSFKTPGILKDKYSYTQLLGEGSNGRTWLAMSFEHKKEVAIKELKDYDTFKQLELFVREAEVLKSIHIPGIPVLYDSIFSSDGQCYLIEEYVPYPSLQTLLDMKIAFHEADILNVMLSVANILKEMETHYTPPIIHRDIKPSNILSHIHDNKTVEAYLIDFGAVAHPEKRGGGSTIAGTYGYMAPEQFQGEADIQSDYYSLGATALHLLTGVSPYTMNSNVFELEFEHHLPKDTTPGMKELLHFLLAPQAMARPENADALITAIKKAMNPPGTCVHHKETRIDRMIHWFQKKFSHNSRTLEIDPKKFDDDHWEVYRKISKIEDLKNPNQLKWEKTNAHIERFIQLHKVIEYSYQIMDKLYCGYISINYNTYKEQLVLASQSQKTKENICMIEYLKEAPCISTNTSHPIYVSKEILDQIEKSRSIPEKKNAYDKDALDPNHLPDSILLELIHQFKSKGSSIDDAETTSVSLSELIQKTNSPPDQADDLLQEVQGYTEEM